MRIHKPLHTKPAAHAPASHDAQNLSQQAAAALPEAASLSEGADSVSPEIIQQLQATHGNYAVQRWAQGGKLQNAPLPANVTQQPRTLIQRRLPDSGEMNTLVTDPNAQIANINLQGVKTALSRMVKGLSLDKHIEADIAVQAKLGLSLGQALQQNDMTRLQAVIDILKGMAVDPAQVTYPGTATSFVTPTGAARLELQKGVEQAAQIMMDIATGKHDQHLKDVFGDHPTFGWKTARKNFFAGAVQLKGLFKKDKIGADRSGENKEMGYGGLTSFETQILLKPEIVDNPTAPESIIVIIHESMHAGVSDVDDHSYKHEDGFPKKSPKDKITTAAFYEEVARRITGTNPVGGVFIPDTNKVGDAHALNNFERARNKAVDQLRVAWILGINIFMGFKEELERQNKDVKHTMSKQTRATLLYNSTLIGLTFHERQAVDPAAKITTLDLMLAEGVTQMFRKAKAALDKVAVADANDIVSVIQPELLEPKNEDLLAAYNIKQALKEIGPINGTTERDIFMIDLINKKSSNLLNIQEAPPTMP